MMENNYDAVTDQAVYNGGNYKQGGYFTTFSGVKINPLDPEAWKLMNVKDIAHASSNICRFGGHCNKFYPLAQHCVLVSYMCDPEDALAGLLHDGSEAYISDIVRPVKETEMFEFYRKIESKLEWDVVKRFGLKEPMPKSVKEADMEVVVWEAKNLFNPTPKWVSDYMEVHPPCRLINLLNASKELEDSFLFPFNCWQPAIAKAKYMKRFLELSGVSLDNPYKDTQ